MSTNFSGDPLSNNEIAEYAHRLRLFHDLGDSEVPNVAALLNSTMIFTRFGEKAFDYQVVDDETLAGDEAVTLVTPKTVRVRVSQSTYSRVLDLDRRARMTIAHELMHGVLHDIEAPLTRPSQKKSSFVSAYVSVERQANFGASSYLITEAMVRSSKSPHDLADRALVSFAAADIRWEREQSRLNRDAVRLGLEKLSAELKNNSRQPEDSSRNNFVCPSCRQRTLQPIGTKYLCVGTCDRVFDGFADGDSP